MIIVKYSIIALLLLNINLNCKKNMDNQYFRIIGSEELLKHCQVNLLKIDERGRETLQTILCKGKLNQVKAENEIGCIYIFYVSYKDSMVNVLKIENIMRNANDHIDYLYLSKERDLIRFQYVGRESEIETKRGFGVFLLPKKEFYKINNIQDKNEIETKELLFFEYYS
jgi:hypothetical protein